MAVVLTLRVFRWAPGAEAYQQDYALSPRPGMTVLDALVEIQRTQDPTLAFRYACRVGMCGSCGVVVDGRERWACRTLLARLAGRPVRLRPLYHFPVVRDLVVDMAPFRARMLAVGAAFVPAAGPPAFAPVGRDTAERRAIDSAIECIGCGLCLSACGAVGRRPDFPGPAALLRAFTLQADRRDAARAERGARLLGEDALPACRTQAGCTAVCPMELEPAAAILSLRRRAAGALLGARAGS